MRNTLETRLGLFFALAMIAAALIFEMVGGTDFLKGATTIRAHFESVQELKPGDPVKMAGVQVGRVDSISLTSNKVEATMKLIRTDQVKTDSKATIKFVGLLGQNYIALDFGSPKGLPITDNTLLATLDQVDLSTIMVKLDGVAKGVENMTRSFSGDTINNLLGPFADFLKENSPKLSTILSNAQTVSIQIAKGEGSVGKMLFDDQLYKSALSAVTNLNTTADDIKSAVAQAKRVVDQVNAGQGNLGKLVKDEALYRETATAATNLKEILQKMNQGQGSVGKLLNDESLYKNAKMTLQKVEKATEGLEDQGPLSVLGIMMNSLF